MTNNTELILENNIFDVAGVRVICSFIDDIYKIEKLFLVQEDIELINRKDYIENPKPGGYRSLHMGRMHIYRTIGNLLKMTLESCVKNVIS